MEGKLSQKVHEIVAAQEEEEIGSVGETVEEKPGECVSSKFDIFKWPQMRRNGQQQQQQPPFLYLSSAAQCLFANQQKKIH